MALLDSLMEKYGDDISKLKDQLESSGLGRKVQSWIGTGENEEITREEVKQGIGEDELDRIARQEGISPDEAADQLSRELPRAVDQATPTGQITSAAEGQRISSPTR